MANDLQGAGEARKSRNEPGGTTEDAEFAECLNDCPSFPNKQRAPRRLMAPVMDRITGEKLFHFGRLVFFDYGDSLEALGCDLLPEHPARSCPRQKTRLQSHGSVMNRR